MRRAWGIGGAGPGQNVGPRPEPTSVPGQPLRPVDPALYPNGDAPVSLLESVINDMRLDNESNKTIMWGPK